MRSRKPGSYEEALSKVTVGRQNHAFSLNPNPLLQIHGVDHLTEF